MPYPRILAHVADMPLAVNPPKLEAVVRFLNEKGAGTVLSAGEIEARTGDATRAADGDQGGQGEAVAVIPVRGLIAQRMNQVNDISAPGGTSTEQLVATIREAADDPRINSIVLDIDSPGGGVPGIPEAAAAIRDATNRKTVVAQINSLAASGAYWLAAQAGEVVITPSGEAGSIGVYTVHQDISRATEEAGITVSLIYAGEYKTEGNLWEPLSDEAREALQARVDYYYRMFTADVAQGRSAALGRTVTAAEVQGGWGRGRTLPAEWAVREGLADRIATLDETLERLAGPREARGGATNSRRQGGGRRAGADTGEPAPENDAGDPHANRRKELQLYERI